MKKRNAEVWQQLRDIFAELQDEEAMDTFKELMSLDLVDEATNYMIAKVKKKVL